MTPTSSASVAAGAGTSRMEADALAEFLRERLGEAVQDVSITFGQLTVTLEPASLPEAARLCRDAPELDFDFYDHNAGVDLGEEGFAVVTHLYSLSHGHHVMLRVVAPGGREAPKVPTLTHLWRGADWHEREVYDMFGIDFEGHPGLLPRILTVTNFEGFPLRKDFLLSTREAKPWPGLKEPKEVGTDGDGSAPEAPTAGGRSSEEGADATAAQAPVSAEEKAQASQIRAERARAKAAAMRAQKAAEKEAAQAATSEEAVAAGMAGSDDEPDAQAAAAEKTTGGDTAGEGAAAVAAAAGEPEPQTPGGAADIARSDIAKDAAAGAVGGDTAAGAPGDRPGTEQPVHDPESEAKVGEGAPPAPSGAPGVEAEGRHGGAERQGTDAPPAPSYGERSYPPDEEEERPAPSDTLDEVIHFERGQAPRAPGAAPPDKAVPDDDEDAGPGDER
ncbi:MAG TPA: NADH-quinone oxidoreductase subunit C [Egibacteraceae bacterium]|nr:NADH-quinone oxidoreductase subunit C [Egibacteraceae bacterium]